MNPIEFVREFGRQDGVYFPFGVAVNSRNEIIVLHSGRGRILLFSPEGNFLSVLVSEEKEFGGFNTPQCIAVNLRDEIIVSDTFNNRILVFSPNGKFLFKFGSKGNEPGQFNNPHGVAVNYRNEIIVIDAWNHRIQVFSQKGKFLFQFGKTQAKLPSIGNESLNQVRNPKLVAINSQNQIIVTDDDYNKIQVFSDNGTFLFEFGLQGYRQRHITSSGGIAVNSRDEIIVSDIANNNVQVFSANGNFLFSLGSGQFHSPKGIAVNSRDEIIVADTYNSRMQLFRDTRYQEISELQPEIVSDTVIITIQNDNQFDQYPVFKKTTLGELKQILSQLDSRSQIIITK